MCDNLTSVFWFLEPPPVGKAGELTTQRGVLSMSKIIIPENYTPALKKGGFVCFEFGMGQGDDVCRILEENGYTILERTRDYNDRERAVLAQYGRKED